MPEPIRIHLDENCAVQLATELRRLGIDVTTTYEVGLKGSTDREQLDFAHAQQRVIVSHDRDMLKLHKLGVAHHGIIYCKINRLTLIELADGILRICGLYDRDGMIGLVVKLTGQP